METGISTRVGGAWVNTRTGGAPFVLGTVLWIQNAARTLQTMRPGHSRTGSRFGYAGRSPRREGGPRMNRSVTVCTGTTSDGVSTRVVRVGVGAGAGATEGGTTSRRRAHRSHSGTRRDEGASVQRGTSDVWTASGWQGASAVAAVCSDACCIWCTTGPTAPPTENTERSTQTAMCRRCSMIERGSARNDEMSKEEVLSWFPGKTRPHMLILSHYRSGNPFWNWL